MKVAVFVRNDEIIVVGLNADGHPIDKDGTLFGPRSGRSISTFERIDANFGDGQIVQIDSMNEAYCI